MIPVVLLLLLAPRAVEADRIRLKNGNILNARILSQDEAAVELEIPNVGRLRFAGSDIESIETDPEPQAPVTHAITLTNGNVIYGRLDDESHDPVEIFIPKTGAMRIARTEIQSVRPLTEAEIAQWTEKTEKKPSSAPKTDASSAPTAEPKASPAPVGSYDEDTEMERVQTEVREKREKLQAGLDRARELVNQAQGLRGQPPAFGRSGLSADPKAALASLPEAQRKLVQALVHVLAMFGLWLPVILIAVCIYYAVCLAKLADVTGTGDEWMAWIPIVHLYLAIRVAGRPGWWILFYLVPLLSLLIDVLVWVGIARSRGRPGWLGLLCLLPLFNLILVGYLAFASDIPQKPILPPGLT